MYNFISKKLERRILLKWKLNSVKCLDYFTLRSVAGSCVRGGQTWKFVNILPLFLPPEDNLLSDGT